MLLIVIIIPLSYELGHQERWSSCRDNNIAKGMQGVLSQMSHTPVRVATQVSLIPGFWATCRQPRSQIKGVNK